jgi:ABC-type glycerol-3-phosphate transport system substrate-binding protein
MVAALTFFGDLVNKDKVASLSFGNPEDAFGQKRAAVIFRESWFFGWLKKNAPDVNFKVYALPCEKAVPGAGALFPWTDLVYKNSPNKQVAWEFMSSSAIQGRHGASPDAGHPSRLDANLDSDYVKSRPDYQSTKACSRSRCRRPTSIRNRTSWPRRSARPSSACCSARDSRKPLLDEAAAKMDRILKD